LAQSDCGTSAFSQTTATPLPRASEADDAQGDDAQAHDAEATASRAASFQPALSVDAFRVLAGLAVCAHYLQKPHFSESAAQQPVAFLGAGALLGLCMALGLAPRVCAAAFVCLSVATYHWFGPETGAAGALVDALAFWVVLLPCGQTLTVHGARGWRRWLERPVSRWAPVACCAFFALFYASLDRAGPAVSPAGVCWLLVAAGCFVAPVGSWRILVVVPAAIGLWNLGHVVPTTLAGATSLALLCLLAGTIGLRRTEEARPRAPMALRAEGAIGACLAVLLAGQLAADRLGMPAIARSTGAILETAGLPELVFVTASHSRIRPMTMSQPVNTTTGEHRS
jgi:hypothetical protein